VTKLTPTMRSLLEALATGRAVTWTPQSRRTLTLLMKRGLVEFAATVLGVRLTDAGMCAVLRPCPFCGHQKPSLIDDVPEVQCGRCQAYVWGETCAEAIRGWNRREEV